MTRIISRALRPIRVGARLSENIAQQQTRGVAYTPKKAASTPAPSSKPIFTPARTTTVTPTKPKYTSASSTASTTKMQPANVSTRITGTFQDPQPATPPAGTVSEYAAATAANPGFGKVPDAPTSFPAPYGGSINGQRSGNGDGNGDGSIDWSTSFHGLSTSPFSPETAAILMRPIDFEDVEIKPDGIIYLPEIKYRRILNTAFGPGGWGMAPRGEMHVGEKVVTREFALVVHGRFVAMARGEMQFFSEDSIATAGEGCKSNALLRCCKDLGIASELWDPRYIREYKKTYGQEIWVEHVGTKKKKLIWVRKGDDPMYPYKRS